MANHTGFSRDTTAFSTMLHRDIYATALRITPPETSLATLANAHPALAASAREFHAFIMALLADMYDDPQAFGMNPGVYEAFANGRKYHAVKRFRPDAARLHCDQAHAELASYHALLKQLAIRCKVENGQAYLSAEDFAYIKRYDYLPSRQKIGAVPVETVLKMLRQSGMAFDDGADGSVRIHHSHYPQMFLAMSELAKSAEASVANPVSKSLKYFFACNYDYLEFRQLSDNYKPVYDDLVRVLSDGDRAVVEAIHQMAKAHKMRETFAHFTIEYHHKGQRVMSIRTDGLWLEPGQKNRQWRRKLTVSVWGSSRPEYQQQVAACGDDFVRYFRRHLNYCSCCNPEHMDGGEGRNPASVGQKCKNLLRSGGHHQKSNRAGFALYSKVP